MGSRQPTPGRLKVASGSFSTKDSQSFDGITRAMAGSSRERRETVGPKLWLCQLAVALTQAGMVVGSVYLKGSLEWVDESKKEVFHPIVFAFAREASAAPILYALSVAYGGYSVPQRRDIVRVASLGAFMFTAHIMYIIGIELSGVIVASCMQPAIPVFTVLMGILLQMETANPQKLSGISLAVAGAICMVIGGVPVSPETASGETSGNMYLGNFCLLVNTFAMACYYILAKKLVVKYSPIQIAAWAYIVAASLMGFSSLIFTSHTDWHFPHSLFAPLLYWILICSVGGYFLVTWAMKHLPASQVAAFQCLQPFLGSLLAFLVLHEKLSWWDCGAIGVVAGLLLVSLDSKDLQITKAMNRLQLLLQSKAPSAMLGRSISRDKM